MMIGERHRRSGRSNRKNSGVEDHRDCVTVSTLANFRQDNAEQPNAANDGEEKKQDDDDSNLQDESRDMITQQAEEQFKARIKRQAEMDLLLEQLAGKLSKSSRQGKRARSSDQLLAAAAIEIE